MIISSGQYASITQRLTQLIQQGLNLSHLEDEWFDMLEYNSMHSLYSQLYVRRVKYETRNFSARRMAEIIFYI